MYQRLIIIQTSIISKKQKVNFIFVYINFQDNNFSKFNVKLLKNHKNQPKIGQIPLWIG